MRFRLPDECAGVALAGLTLARDADGTIEAEEGAVEALAPHDIRPVDMPDAVETASEGVKRNIRRRNDERRMLR